MKKDANNYIWIFIIAVILFVFYIYVQSSTGVPEGKYNSFAQCLAEKKITMYGSKTCPWCNKEKANFGSAFRFVPYVECPENNKLCLDLDIKSYPTWIFPSTSSGQVPGGKKIVGYLGLENLAKESGCPLP